MNTSPQINREMAAADNLGFQFPRRWARILEPQVGDAAPRRTPFIRSTSSATSLIAVIVTRCTMLTSPLSSETTMTAASVCSARPTANNYVGCHIDAGSSSRFVRGKELAPTRTNTESTSNDPLHYSPIVDRRHFPEDGL